MGNPRAKKGVQTGSEGVRGRNKSEQQVDSRSKLGKEGVVSPPPQGQIRNWEPETQAGQVGRSLRQNIKKKRKKEKNKKPLGRLGASVG